MVGIINMKNLQARLEDQVADARNHTMRRVVMYEIAHGSNCTRVTLHTGTNWLNDRGYVPQEFNFRSQDFDKAVEGYLTRMGLTKAVLQPSEDQF